jgi:3-phenylpropionate/trans-cinnamate dioxygenase ferredoxin subunit
MACTLAAGYLEGYTIKCPCHDWKFDIRTGEFLDAREIKIPTYELRLAEKKVFVKV